MTYLFAITILCVASLLILSRKLLRERRRLRNEIAAKIRENMLRFNDLRKYQTRPPFTPDS